jgi:hypothetical protein
MKAVTIILSFFFFLQEDFPEIFTMYEGDQKAILIFASDNQSKPYYEMISILTRDPLGIDKRNITIFEIFRAGGIGPYGESISEEDVTTIRKYYDIGLSNFNVILTVRKFEEILKTDKPISIDKIFEQFDQQE